MSEEAEDPGTYASVAHHQRRALLLECLRKYDEPVSLPDLADEVAVREHEAQLTAIEPEEVRDIYLSLYHRHVPKLGDVGLVEYDQQSDLVAVADDVDLDPIIDQVSNP